MKRSHVEGKRRVDAVALLHKIGTQEPYFSLTGTEYEAVNGRWREVSGGCIHETLLAIWPDLKPLADLHLSTEQGVPMHAVANGWYWLAGAVEGNFEEKYHGSNGSTGCTPEKSLEILAQHVRIPMGEARALRTWLTGFQPKVAKSMFNGWVQQQELRWKLEADAAITTFGLTTTEE